MNTEMIVCDQCSAPLEADSRFCRNCGRSLLPHAAAADPLEEGLSWETNISLLTNPLILKQTALTVLGACLVMAFIMSFLLAVMGDFRGIPFILLVFLLIGIALALFTCLIMLFFFGNRMRVRFTVDGKGVLWKMVDKRFRATSRLAIVAGILGRSPQAAGAGALAVAREKEFVRWQDLSAVDYNKGRLMLTLRNSRRPLMLVVCLPENYGRVAAFVEKHVVPTPVEILHRRGAGPLAKGLWRTILVSLAVKINFAAARWI